jgi:enoyl-CoA hydratase/carnithine racemase
MSVITIEAEGSVRLVTLNRPERMNALGRELVEGLHRAFAELGNDPTVSVIVLTGAGERAFCAGADLREREGMSETETWAFLDALKDAFLAVETCPVPTVAAINGFALGGGLELALCCDIRLAASSARVGLTEVRLGIIPGAGGTQRLPEVVGTARARELIFTGRRIDADTAMQWGLVSEVSPQQELRAGALRVAGEIAAGGPLALRAAKLALTGSLADQRADQLRREREAYAPLLKTDDRLEALAAFREKRAPVFKGR